MCNDVMFDIDRYLAIRGDATIKSWGDWVEHTKFRQDDSRAAALNWLTLKDHGAPGKADRVARSYIGRLALERVMCENRLDAFVHPENTVPTPKIQGPNVGAISLEGITPFLQVPRVVVPAGMITVVYEPQYALNPAKTDYISVLAPGTPRSTLPHPMPVAITLFAGQVANQRSSKLAPRMRRRRTIARRRRHLARCRDSPPRRHPNGRPWRRRTPSQRGADATIDRVRENRWRYGARRGDEMTDSAQDPFKNAGLETATERSHTKRF